MKIYIYILFSIICFNSCVFSTDYIKGFSIGQDTELGDAIWFYGDDTTCFRYLGDSSKYLEKGSFIKYHSRERVDTVFTWGESVVVPSHVNKMISDSIFILVDQKPLDSIFGEIVDFEDYSRRPYKPDNLDEDIRVLNESNIHLFWIINKKTNDIYGPLSKKEYSQKRKELRIFKGLTLNEK